MAVIFCKKKNHRLSVKYLTHILSSRGYTHCRVAIGIQYKGTEVGNSGLESIIYSYIFEILHSLV